MRDAIAATVLFALLALRCGPLAAQGSNVVIVADGEVLGYPPLRFTMTAGADTVAGGYVPGQLRYEAPVAGDSLTIGFTVDRTRGRRCATEYRGSIPVGLLGGEYLVLYFDRVKGERCRGRLTGYDLPGGQFFVAE